MSFSRDHLLIIETPEGVRFTMTLASPVTRFLALTLDLVIVYGIVYLIGMIASIAGVLSADLANILMIIGIFVITIGYFLFCEWLWRGQTFGKRVFNIRVVDAQGLRLQTDQIILRNLLRFVDSLPFLYFLGGTVSVFSRKSQRLGDIAAGTVVIRQKSVSPPDFSRLTENKYNSLREHPHMEAILRQRVSSELASLAFQALLRRQSLDADARVKLFRELAEEIKSLANFPEEVSFGVSDEQFVRNCVESIFRQSTKKAPTSGADKAVSIAS
ncbi:MAG: RDD family protein [Verrucomicrobiota bacterium]